MASLRVKRPSAGGGSDESGPDLRQTALGGRALGDVPVGAACRHSLEAALSGYPDLSVFPATEPAHVILA